MDSIVEEETVIDLMYSVIDHDGFTGRTGYRKRVNVSLMLHNRFTRRTEDSNRLDVFCLFQRWINTWGQ